MRYYETNPIPFITVITRGVWDVVSFHNVIEARHVRLSAYRYLRKRVYLIFNFHTHLPAVRLVRKSIELDSISHTKSRSAIKDSRYRGKFAAISHCCYLILHYVCMYECMYVCMYMYIYICFSNPLTVQYRTQHSAANIKQVSPPPSQNNIFWSLLNRSSVDRGWLCVFKSQVSNFGVGTKFYLSYHNVIGARKLTKFDAVSRGRMFALRNFVAVVNRVSNPTTARVRVYGPSNSGIRICLIKTQGLRHSSASA